MSTVNFTAALLLGLLLGGIVALASSTDGDASTALAVSIGIGIFASVSLWFSELLIWIEHNCPPHK